MNRFSTVLMMLLISSLGFSQTQEFKNGFGINQDFHDYNVRLSESKIASFDSALSQSLRVSYNRFLGNTWSLSVGISNGFLLNQTPENKLVRKSYLFGGDIDLLLNFNNGRWMKTDALVAPYLSFGYNFNYLSAYKKLGLTPMVTTNEYGLGIKVKLGEKSKIVLGTALNQQLNGAFETHMQYRLGFNQTIGKKSVVKPVEPKKVIDTDKDGIADVDDKCPEIPGTLTNEGCPQVTDVVYDQSISEDSMMVLIDNLEQDLLDLKSDVYNLSRDQVIKVVYSEPIVMADPVKDENYPDKPVYKDPEPKDIDDTPTKPIVKVEKTPIVEDDKSKESETPRGSDKPTYKNPNEDLSFYVVAISTKDKSLAEKSAVLISKDYQKVRVLPQPNGFYRVGIYATKSRPEALKILEYAKTHGIPSGWISYE